MRIEDRVLRRIICGLTTFFAAIAWSLGTTAGAQTDDAVGTVRLFYALAGTASSPDVGTEGGGTLGDARGYYDAYGLTTSSFRARFSEAAFVGSFTHTAFIRLDQALPAQRVGNRPCVFVEDEREMVLEHLPATVWYFGTMCLSRENGRWRIATIEVHPDRSLIALRDGGHGSAGYLADVANLAFATALGLRVYPPLANLTVPFNAPSLPSPITLEYRYGSKVYVGQFARLHSGAYEAISVAELSVP